MKTRNLIDMEQGEGAALAAVSLPDHQFTAVAHVSFASRTGLSELLNRVYHFDDKGIEGDKQRMQHGALEVRVCQQDAGDILKVDDVALAVANPQAVIDKASQLGLKTEHQGSATCIEIYPGLRHTLLDGGVDGEQASMASALSFECIDHLAICVPEYAFETVLERYQSVFELEVCHQEYVDTKVSAMDSVVLSNVQKTITLVFMKPCAGKERSQIQRFIDVNGGAGVQHLAFKVGNINLAARELKAAGVEFLDVPPTYYQDLPNRVANLPEDIDELSRLGILVDEDEDGLLLQVFTKPLLGDKTVFLELIERRGNLGFGSGNIKALFKAVEQDMQKTRK